MRQCCQVILHHEIFICSSSLHRFLGTRIFMICVLLPVTISSNFSSLDCVGKFFSFTGLRKIAFLLKSNINPDSIYRVMQWEIVSRCCCKHPQLGPDGDVGIQRTKKGQLSIKGATVDVKGELNTHAVKTGSISVDGVSLEKNVQGLIADALGKPILAP